MNTTSIARASQHWQTGGILQRVEWDTEPCKVRLWGGKVQEVKPGDEVVLFWRGLPFVDIVEVSRP